MTIWAIIILVATSVPVTDMALHAPPPWLDNGVHGVLYAVLATRRPSGPVVEIGTQYGRSTRRILDMIDLLGLDTRVICYDIHDDVRHFRKLDSQSI